MNSDRDFRPIIFFFVMIAIILSVGLFTPIRSKISNRIDEYKSFLYYRENPPGKDVFVPQQQLEFSLTETVMAAAATQEVKETASALTAATPSATLPQASIVPVLSAMPTQTATATPKPSETPAPLPADFQLEGIKYEDQHGVWNYCAPANLSMALTYWGWGGDRLTAGKWLKPFDKDKNVMFYEMQNFVTEMTELRSIVRHIGNAELLKRLIINGFPVLIEKGSFMQEVNGNLSWMGHYNLVTGYDDNQRLWTVQDSYYQANHTITYDKLDWEWKSFNYEFMIVYPGDREADLYHLLGPFTDENWVNRNAFEAADQQVKEAVTDEDFFYAYFNRGSAQVDLNDFYGAAQSYDLSFHYYANLEEKNRPYRIVWYQTGPYYAYYYTGRYQDLITLADITLASTKEPFLEESYYWRAMAYRALGETGNAQDDLKTCLEVHPGFSPCTTLSAELGGS